MKRFAKRLIVVGVVLGFGSGNLLAQTEKIAIPQEAMVALQYYLDVDCEVDRGGEPLNQLLKFKDVLEASLITLLKEGPDQQTLSEVQRTLDQRWAQREAFLRQNPELGLKEEDLQRARSVTKEDYIKQGREQFIQKYREKAAIGLAAIGSPEGIKTLREVSEKANGDLRSVIQSALKQFRRK